MMAWENQTVWTNYMLDRGSAPKIEAVDVKLMKTLSVLQVKNYSRIDSIMVILVALSPIGFPEPEKLYFRKKKNEIHICINLDYESLLQADEAQTLRLIAQTYLAAISRFLGKRKDFDSARFYADAEKLFRENGYLG